MQVEGDEPLAKSGSRNVVLQIVIDHNRAEVEEVRLRPGFINGLRGNQAEPDRVDGIFQSITPFFICTYQQDGHALSLVGAATGVND